jgi:integrase
MVRQMRLTDLSIRALKAPEKGAIIYADDTLVGFGVRVSQAGTKSYVLTHGAQRKRETLGRVGVVSLQDARAEAKRRLAEYTLGKHSQRSVAWIVGLQEYLREVAVRCKPRVHEDYSYILGRHFRFGETKLSDVSPADLQARLGKLVGTPAEHQHAFVVLRAFINWAHRKAYLDRNPMERMRPPHRYRPRERVLSEDELCRVWTAADAMPMFGNIVRVLILTGQRVGEICGLTHDMIGHGTITLPSSLTKNSRAHTFPISPACAEIIKAQQSNGSPYVFPARASEGSSRPFNGLSKSKERIHALSGTSGWTLHDLRRTFASGLASLGVPLPVTEKLLNHVSGSFAGIVGVYQRYDYLPEMQSAVEKWEAHVQTLAAYGRQPRGIAMLPTWENRDAAFIEEASARDGLVLPSTHRSPGGGWEVPEKGATWPSTGRVGRTGSARLAQVTDR